MTKIKKQFKKLQKLDKQIKEKQLELRNAQDPLNGYYLQFQNETKRAIEVLEIQVELKALLSLRFLALENLQLACELEKADTSQSDRGLIMIINEKI